MDNLKNIRNPGDEVHFASQPVVTEDEINLIDLWLILVRRKRMIVAGLLLGATVAAAFSFFTPEKYRFYTTITLGQLKNQSAGATMTMPLENPETTLANLKNGYFPQVLEQAATKNKNTKGYRLQATNPKNSNLVIIEATGSLQDESVYLQLISNATQALIRDHNRIFTPVEAALSAKIEHTKLELEAIRNTRIFTIEVNTLKQGITDTKHNLSALKDQRKIIESRYKHIGVEDEFTRKQLQDNESILKTALKDQATSIKQSSNPATAIALLMLSNEIQHYQDRIATLDQHLDIHLPEKQTNLEKQLIDNMLAQQHQTNLINNHELKLEKLHIKRKNKESIQVLAIKELETHAAGRHPTQMLHPASRSISPVGSSMTLKVILGLIIGLMLGIFGAFATEFLAKASKLKSLRSPENKS